MGELEAQDAIDQFARQRKIYKIDKTSKLGTLITKIREQNEKIVDQQEALKAIWKQPFEKQKVVDQLQTLNEIKELSHSNPEASNSKAHEKSENFETFNQQN